MATILWTTARGTLTHCVILFVQTGENRYVITDAKGLDYANVLKF